jgi:serine/threonine protein kinase
MSRLPPGTQIRDWRVVDWHSQGGFGAVYRALRVGHEHSGPAALKLSLFPWDARFSREATLLSRLHHPGIPRLLGQGIFEPSPGFEHPFLVMEWIDGTPLYTWAEQHVPSCRQVCLLLASLARALAVIHAANAVHRDVKGDNVLVRHSDGQPVLIDFGSCHFQGAPRLTWQSLAPHTAAYRSAQAGLFYIRSVRDRDSYYQPSPADDLFALGVTAYRLVMGEYPPPMDAQEDESGSWRVFSPDPRPHMENNPRVEPPLRELILRLLSDVPEKRGTAVEMTEALEAAADMCAPEPLPASPPAEVSPPRAPAPADTRERTERPGRRVLVRVWEPWLALAVAGVAAVLLWISQAVSTYEPASTQQASASQAPDAGPAAVGDTSPTAPLASVHPPPEPTPLAQEPLLEPRPDQLRPDKNGRCSGPMQVAINGGCWFDASSSVTAEACEKGGYVLFRGKCYSPALATPRKPLPTSNPAKAR